MAIKESTEESNPDEDEDIDINDPPIHVNNHCEPPGELALIILGVHLRSRPSITGIIHLESGSHDPSLQTQPIIITGDCQLQAQESNSKSLPKKKNHASDGNNAERLQQGSTHKNLSTSPAMRSSGEPKTGSRQEDKELHAKKPSSDPVNDNQPRGYGSAENYNYSSETSSDQILAAAASRYTHPQQTRATHASGYTHPQQTRATHVSGYTQPQQTRAAAAFDQRQQLNYLNSTRSQPPISQAQRHTSSLVSPETNSLPPPQNGSLHTNINSQINSIPCIPQNGSLHTNTHINSIPCVPLSVPAVNPASQPAHQTTSPLVRDLNLQDLGIFYERPKKPEYAILAKRIESFQGWPVDSPVTKEDVAKSGFYYEGYKDGGRCFFCGGILGEWKSGDDPFVEHARWYPKCGYIRQYKGQAFIDIVQKIKTHSSNITQITSAMVVEEMNRLGLEESNAFDEDPVEHDAAVTSLLDEIMSLKSTLRYTREEVIHAAQILRRQSIALSSDLILSQLTHNHDATYSGAQGATASLGASNAGTIEELKDQNSTLRSNLICKICMDKEVKIVFLPCGHLVSCQECAMALYNCPICLSQIRAYVRANIRSL